MAKVLITRIELTGQAKATLAATSDRHGMTQIAMMSRLVEFFYQADDNVKRLIVGSFGDLESDVARLVLRKMGG